MVVVPENVLISFMHSFLVTRNHDLNETNTNLEVKSIDRLLSKTCRSNVLCKAIAVSVYFGTPSHCNRRYISTDRWRLYNVASTSIQRWFDIVLTCCVSAGSILGVQSHGIGLTGRKLASLVKKTWHFNCFQFMSVFIAIKSHLF